MKKIVIILLAIMAFMLFLSDRSKAELALNPRPATIDDLMRIKNIHDVQISPDGTQVLYVISEPDVENNRYDRDVWLAQTDGQKAFKLASSPQRDDNPLWSPDGKTVAFISDRGGSNQIWLISPSGGEALQLSDVHGGIGSFYWSPDSKKIAFLLPDLQPEEKKKRQEERGSPIIVDDEPRMVHIHLIEVTSKKTWQLTSGKFFVDTLSWSPDAKNIVFSARPSPSIPDLFNTDIYTVDVQGQKIRKIVEKEGADTSPQWSPDGRMIAFVSNDGLNEWIANWYICVVSTEGGEPSNISRDFKEFVTSCQWSSDSRTLYFQSSKGLTTQLFAVSVKTGKVRQVSQGIRVHRDFSFSHESNRMAFLVSTSTTPSEVFVSPMDEFKPLCLTRTNSFVDDIDLGKTEVIRWKSHDGLEIEGLLIKPVGFRPGESYPLLTYVHGGPSGKFEVSFSPQIGGSSPIQGESYPLHVLAGQGFAIFMPNPRGSYGYGEPFRRANVNDWGHGDYFDIISGIDYLIEKGVADPLRLGIMGRSYGGYMTSWIITQTTRFKAASLGAGMSNLVSFYGQTDIPGYMEFYFSGDPWTRADEYTKRSP
ncbi:MAG: S9 family peptidase [Candidatus Aminicenantes bacterium]|nr:MAG: S9 family peptidase [Candidatus Aminicenantes bacterium]